MRDRIQQKLGIYTRNHGFLTLKEFEVASRTPTHCVGGGEKMKAEQCSKRVFAQRRRYDYT